MQLRKDISDFVYSLLTEEQKRSYMRSEIIIFEQNNLLYSGQTDSYDNYIKNIFNYYTPLNHIFWFTNEIKTKVCQLFKVDVSKTADIVCKCGKKDCFSAHYGSYSLLLTCNNCDNKFEAYSG